MTELFLLIKIFYGLVGFREFRVNNISLFFLRMNGFKCRLDYRVRRIIGGPDYRGSSVVIFNYIYCAILYFLFFFFFIF